MRCGWAAWLIVPWWAVALLPTLVVAWARRPLAVTLAFRGQRRFDIGIVGMIAGARRPARVGAGVLGWLRWLWPSGAWWPLLAIIVIVWLVATSTVPWAGVS